MITVVIPTLNSAQALESALPALMPATLQGMISRVVISDGGSEDETEAIAAATGAEFVTGEAGRGGQIARGAELARSFQKPQDWLLFLHADTVLQEGWEKEAASFIMSAGAKAAAYFSFRFDENVWQARVVEAGVWWRCRLLSLPYGDQGLLISRAFYDALGGYGPMPLFEDVDLVQRIVKNGNLRPLRAVATTSADRYKQNGYFPRVWKNFNCLMSYYRGVPPEKILENYQ
ncbi:MAG: TIGR04283 family arsenosugar biosynthesis glycosyltransferase [Aquisalinus sp.]|nr:TIGR04283 family arsenosugar biosynthesis glycosyltransferase [Aquisalinus sp.]